MKKITLLSLILLIWIPFSIATASGEHNASGKIVSIDKSNKTLNISHGPIKGLGMTAMSMDFGVADPAMLDDVKPGQSVDFVVTTNSRGRYIVVDIE